MKNKQKNFESEKTNKHDGVEAYQTLVNWVKSVPNTIKEIEQSGSKEELIRYKKQVKMIVEKLKEIEDNYQIAIYYCNIEGKTEEQFNPNEPESEDYVILETDNIQWSVDQFMRNRYITEYKIIALNE